MMMYAPVRKAKAAEENRSFVYRAPKAGRDAALGELRAP